MTKTLYRYQWSKMDARHTISNVESPRACECWTRGLRAGCPWKITAMDTGSVIAEGIGPFSEWWNLPDA